MLEKGERKKESLNNYLKYLLTDIIAFRFRKHCLQISHLNEEKHLFFSVNIIYIFKRTKILLLFLVDETFSMSELNVQSYVHVLVQQLYKHNNQEVL